jgi:hypothetical protein
MYFFVAELNIPPCPYNDLPILDSSVKCRSQPEKMKRIHALNYLIVAIIAWSCESQLKVSTDYDRAADFTKYKTFGFYNSESLSKNVSQLNHDRIINAIKNEMIKRGLQESASAPDLMVNTTAILQDRQSVASTNYYAYGSVYRPYTWGPGVSYTNYDVRHYKDGSLIIDVVDAGTQKLVWQGTGNKEIDSPSKNPDVDIPKAIASIMADFPPGSKKK